MITEAGRDLLLSLAHGEARELADRLNRLHLADPELLQQTVTLLDKLSGR